MRVAVDLDGRRRGYHIEGKTVRLLRKDGKPGPKAFEATRVLAEVDRDELAARMAHSTLYSCCMVCYRPLKLDEDGAARFIGPDCLTKAANTMTEDQLERLGLTMAEIAGLKGAA